MGLLWVMVRVGVRVRVRVRMRARVRVRLRVKVRCCHGRRLDQLLGAVVVARVIAVGGRAERVDGVGGGPMGGGMGVITSGRAAGEGGGLPVQLDQLDGRVLALQVWPRVARHRVPG
jgi:hypothetical protein